MGTEGTIIAEQDRGTAERGGGSKGETHGHGLIRGL